MGKIKILFANSDKAGVFYWRTQTPAIQLETDYSDIFEVEINQNVNWDDYDYLSKFNIIHSHRMFCDFNNNEKFFSFCKKNGIITILDIDDNPNLHPKHPLYNMVLANKTNEKTFDTLKMCDGVTTTTEYFKEYLSKYNKNVVDLQNGINKEIMPQFSFKRKEYDKIRLGWVGGSSHLDDIIQLEHTFGVISSSPDLNQKLRVQLHGYDMRGGINQMFLNPDLLKDASDIKINLSQLINQFNNCNGDIDKIKILPENLKDKYRKTFIQYKNRGLETEDSVWFKYEKIFTDNYKLVKESDYLTYLKSYKNEPSDVESVFYKRFYTKSVNSYASHYDEIDISLIPLTINEFNLCKSPLKIAEAQAKKCAVIVYDNPIYTKYIKHGINGFIAKDQRDWVKYIKKYVNTPSLIKEHSEQLYLDTKDVFDLKQITKKRADFYLSLIK